MSEQLRNTAQTTLNGAINNSVTSLTVASASLFPTSGDFRIKIDSEIMLVTAVAGNTFTVTRAVESTTAASHSNNADVAQVVTTLGLDKYRQNFLLSGTVASLPAAGLAGRVYHPTDSIVVFHDDGTQWHAIGPMWKFNIPQLANYTIYNQGTATISQLNEGIWLDCPSNSGVDQLRCVYKTRSSTGTGYKLTVAFSMSGGQSNVRHAGVFLFDPTSKRIEGLRILCDSNSQSPKKQSISYTDPANGTPTGISTSVDIGYFGHRPFLHWVQIEQTGSQQYTFRYSQNGILWYDDAVRNSNGGFSGTPSSILLMVSPYSGPGSAIFRHVKEEP